MPTSAQLTAQVSLGSAELVALLQSQPRARRARMRAAADTVLEGVGFYTRRGSGLLADVLGRHAAFEEWAHYPPRDALDKHSGYRFYYHAHSRRARGEHGHFHVFGPTAREPGYLHLFGISVDDKGFPTRVFTTNQWVTAEPWLPAAGVLRNLARLDLSQARPARVARWVQAMAELFAPQIAASVQRRDARIAQRAARDGEAAALNDRRTHIVSQCQVDLARQFQLLDAAGIA